MFNLLTRYRHISLFLLFLLISLALLSFNRPADTTIKPSNMLERVMLVVLEPFQSAVSMGVERIQDVWQGYLALVHLSEENQRLHEEIRKLRAEKNRYIENALAYERLKGTLALVEKRQFSTVLAGVIGYDSSNQSHSIIVNKGTNDGVRESWPVITQDGIVGVTVSVSKKSSKVLLLIDPNCNVAALLQRTRDQGIVGGQTRKDAYTMKYVSRRAIIQEGTIFRLTDQSLVEIAKEGVPGYTLTEQTFAKLQENNISQDILVILEAMKDQQYPTQKAFVKALETTIGQEQTNWYKSIILHYAQSDVLEKLRRLRNLEYSTKEAFVHALGTTIGEELAEKYTSSIIRHVQEEETVVSSGLGGIFPKGLMIGTVSKVVKRSYGLFQEIEITPSVDFSKLEEVLIIRREDDDTIAAQ